MNFSIQTKSNRKTFSKKKKSIWSILINLLLITGIILLSASLIGEVSAKKLGFKSKKGEIVTVLSKIESLYFISQDLDEDAAMLIRPESDCYCSCRDSAWSCTSLNCDFNLKECSKAQAALTGSSEQTTAQTPDYMQALPPIEQPQQSFQPQEEPTQTEPVQNVQELPNYSSQAEILDSTPSSPAPTTTAVERDPRFMTGSRY